MVYQLQPNKVRAVVELDGGVVVGLALRRIAWRQVGLSEHILAVKDVDGAVDAVAAEIQPRAAPCAHAFSDEVVAEYDVAMRRRWKPHTLHLPANVSTYPDIRHEPVARKFKIA